MYDTRSIVKRVVARTFLVNAFADYCYEYCDATERAHPNAAGGGEDWMDATPDYLTNMNVLASERAEEWLAALEQSIAPRTLEDYLASYDAPVSRHGSGAEGWAHKAAMSALGHGVFPGDDGEDLPTTADGVVLEHVPSIEVWDLSFAWDAHYQEYSDLETAYPEE